MPAGVLKELHGLWLRRGEVDEYVGTLVNAWIADGGEAWGARIGRSYVNVGTLHGYREAIGLAQPSAAAGPGRAAARPGGRADVAARRRDTTARAIAAMASLGLEP